MQIHSLIDIYVTLKKSTIFCFLAFYRFFVDFTSSQSHSSPCTFVSTLYPATPSYPPPQINLKNKERKRSVWELFCHTVSHSYPVVHNFTWKCLLQSVIGQVQGLWFLLPYRYWDSSWIPWCCPAPWRSWQLWICRSTRLTCSSRSQMRWMLEWDKSYLCFWAWVSPALISCQLSLNIIPGVSSPALPWPAHLAAGSKGKDGLSYSHALGPTYPHPYHHSHLYCFEKVLRLKFLFVYLDGISLYSLEPAK